MSHHRINGPIAKTYLGWCMPLALALFTGCASFTDTPTSAPEKVSATNYATYGAISRVEYLHLLNLRDIPGLQTTLQKTLSYDVLALWSLLQYPISSDERARAYQVLRLIAIQNEKFPVPGWNDDAEVKSILQAAIANDPAHAENLRARNWNKPMWQK
jgi:hypothetical protein